MKKKVAMILAIMLAMGSMSACGEAKKVNNNMGTSMADTAVEVSVYEDNSEVQTSDSTEVTAQKTIVSQNSKTSNKNTKSDEKADSRQNSSNKTHTKTAQSDIKNTEDEKVQPTDKLSTEKGNSSAQTQQNKKSDVAEKPTEKPIQKPTQPPTEEPIQKSTQPPTEAKMADVQNVVRACITYGQQLGMKYDSSLNTANASWFSPTNASYYDDTKSLMVDCYADVEYVACFYQDSGIKPSDLSFNVVAENNKIYVVYC